VSTVSLHAREERPFLVQSAPSEKNGTFVSPVFDPTGALLAAYDSGSDVVFIFQSSNLKPVNRLKPTRRPRRLSFSQGGHFLVIEAYQGWIEDFLGGRTAGSRVDVDSPAAVRDDIQRAEVWNLQTGQTIPDLGCDAVVTSEPKGGWLWARKWAITPGYRRSALLEAHFSADETEFSILCWNGVQQRWDTGSWKRLESSLPPPFWDPVMGLAAAKWLPGNSAPSGSADGRIAALDVQEKHSVFATAYIWDRDVTQVRQLQGDCGTMPPPIYSLSSDGNRVVIVCSKGLGHSIRAWDVTAGKEIPLRDADFGVAGGVPIIRDAALSLSPDGRHVAVALLNLTEALVVTPVPAPFAVSRSDLRLWSVDEGREFAAVPIDDLVVDADYFRGVDLAFSRDSARLAVGGRRLRIYGLSDLGAGRR
jgi:WD40 repeat protein